MSALRISALRSRSSRTLLSTKSGWKLCAGRPGTSHPRPLMGRASMKRAIFLAWGRSCTAFSLLKIYSMEMTIESLWNKTRLAISAILAMTWGGALLKPKTCFASYWAKTLIRDPKRSRLLHILGFRRNNCLSKIRYNLIKYSQQPGILFTKMICKSCFCSRGNTMSCSNPIQWDRIFCQPISPAGKCHIIRKCKGLTRATMLKAWNIIRLEMQEQT